MRFIRDHCPSIKYHSFEYMLVIVEAEPQSSPKVGSHEDSGNLLRAMHDKMDSFYKNETYELVELLKGIKELKNKFVFKLKRENIGKLVKYKVGWFLRP